jgi:hypothetical protein
VRVDSLEELVAAFGEWRRRKRYEREPTPEELVKRARRAAGVHGLGRVARAVKLLLADAGDSWTAVVVVPHRRCAMIQAPANANVVVEPTSAA